MSFWNNTTGPLISNIPAQDQPNSMCSSVDSSAERFSKICVLFFILLGSFFGNFFIIIIVYKNRDLRKTINYFIVNMALSDLVYPLILFPVRITELVTDSYHWHFSGILGLIFCKLYYFAISVSLLVSSQSLVWIAIDRFVAVVFPLKLGLISSKIRTIGVVSTWMCAGFFSSPLLMSSKLAARGNDTVCTETSSESFFSSQKANPTYVWFQFSLLIIGPLVVITFLYTVIAIALKMQQKPLSGTPSNAQRHALKKRRQAIKMAVTILVLFYLCVTPHTLLYLIPYWKPSCSIQRTIYLVASFSFFLSSTVNPMICLTFVESYRRGLKNILCPCG